MKTLDGDDVRISSRGRYAERDIVQVCVLLHLTEIDENSFTCEATNQRCLCNCRSV